jgi:hypothetical protein
MGYIIAYLLLALVIDLIRELINPEGDNRNSVAIRRRLWSDSLFDCRTKVFSVKGNAVRQLVRKQPIQGQVGWKDSKTCFTRAYTRASGFFLTVPGRRRL